MNIRLPYGKGALEFSLPRHRLLGILKNKQPARKDIRKLLSGSLNKSSGIKRLNSLIRYKRKILVVVPDCTRSAHLKDILPYLLKIIEDKNRKTDIIVATGLHKKHTAKQLAGLLGSSVIKNHRVLSHEHNKKSLANFGFTRGGIPIILNVNLKKYDFIISVGVVEPHLYAGYSGGAKTIAIGLAGEKTINVTHNIKFLDNPLTKIGSVKGNPFQKALWEIAAKSPVGFSINVVNDPDGRAVKIFSGRLREVYDNAVDFAGQAFEVKARKKADIVICGVGHPKDINLYQASRAINYIINDHPVIRRGGVLIVAAGLNEGAGDGISEKRFYKELKDMRSPGKFVSKIKREGCVAGVHRAYMVAKPLLDYTVVFVSDDLKGIMKGLPLRHFKDIGGAMDFADNVTGRNSKIYVIPRALSTIARLDF